MNAKLQRPAAMLRVALGLVCLLATPLAAEAVTILEGPTLTMDPYGFTPLAGLVELETDVPVQVQLTLTDGADVRVITFPDAATVHALPVLGLKPARTTTVDVEMIPGGPAGSLLATTGALPADFPTLGVLVSDPSQMEPGYTLIDCPIAAAGQEAYTIIVDAAGEVVWYSTHCGSAIRQLPNGLLLYRVNSVLVKQDMLGYAPTLALADPGVGLHHDLFLTPHGTYLSLSTRAVEVENFPSSETDPDAPPATAMVRDEPVVEFFADGTLRKEWSLVEMLDTTRLGYNSLNNSANGYDWVHTNAVGYNLEDDSIIVSARHQDAVFKFSRETGELIWILGTHDNWSAPFQPLLLDPVNAPFRWQFHQHAPMWTGPDSILLFDNGNLRASPFDGNVPVPDSQNFSRGVEYRIDESLMQVEQIWEYGENIPEWINSFFISDADLMPTTGNRLLDFGGVNFIGGVSSASLGRGVRHTRIIEVTGGPVPVRVFDLEMYDAGGGSMSAYRAERIPSLYPPEYIKAPNGVGNTVRVDKVGGAPRVSWMPSPLDSAHGAADYYLVYASATPSGGFAITESTAFTEFSPGGSSDPLTGYLVVAANTTGTSGDEP